MKSMNQIKEQIKRRRAGNGLHLAQKAVMMVIAEMAREGRWEEAAGCMIMARKYHNSIPVLTGMVKKYSPTLG